MTPDKIRLKELRVKLSKAELRLEMILNKITDYYLLVEPLEDKYGEVEKEIKTLKMAIKKLTNDTR